MTNVINNMVSDAVNKVIYITGGSASNTMNIRVLKLALKEIKQSIQKDMDQTNIVQIVDSLKFTVPMDSKNEDREIAQAMIYLSDFVRDAQNNQLNGRAYFELEKLFNKQRGKKIQPVVEANVIKMVAHP